MPKKKKLYGKSRSVSIGSTTLEILSWIKRGSFRKKVLLHVNKKTMPSEITKLLVGKQRISESDYAMVSRALQELEMQGLVKCLNPEEKTGRFYSVTKKGEKIKKELV